LATLLLFAGCQSEQAQRPFLVPADPAAVLDGYLQALKTGDCTFARALATQEFGDDHFCGEALRVTDFRVMPNPSRPNASELVFALTLWTVGGDDTMLDGSHTWFFQLKRQADDRWLVSGGGSGP
jgi:hypothetical protein